MRVVGLLAEARGRAEVVCQMRSLVAYCLIASSMAAWMPYVGAESNVLERTSKPQDFLADAESLLATLAEGAAPEVFRSLVERGGLAVHANGVQPRVADPIGALLSAVNAAEALRIQAVAGLTPQERSLALDPFLVMSAAPSPAPTASTGKSATLSANGIEANPLLAPLAGKIDLGALAAAELLLLQTVMDSAAALKELPLEPHNPHAPSACGATGDMLFETSDCRVMVGNTGPNGYGPGVDPILLIDVGGADSYTNGAANANSGVRVLIDVAGNDAYTVAGATAAAGAGPTVQGIAAASLGVALLADLGGNDVYSATATATAPQPGPVAGTSTVRAQASATLGAAVLLDAGGDDTFTATASSSGGSAVVAAQGSAALGVAALINLGPTDGAADDATLSQATSTLHLIAQSPQFSQFQIGPASVTSQGAALLGGVAALADGGGNDALTATATAGIAATTAQGAAVGGVGILVDGTGNDVLLANAVGDTILSLITTDPTFCWEVSVSVATGETRTLAQGATTLGAGLLVDGTGNDARTVSATSRAVAVAEATSNFDCSFIAGNKAAASATSGPGTAIGQGSGATGAGVLVDVTGTDTNTLAGASHARARAIATSPGPDVETATATAGAGETRGQGHSQTGVGLLADIQDADMYGSVAASTATTEKTSGVVVVTGPRLQSVQGYGSGGLGWLLELGGTDLYTTSPAPASLAANNACWSNGPNGGRGRDFVLGSLLPAGCP